MIRKSGNTRAQKSAPAVSNDDDDDFALVSKMPVVRIQREPSDSSDSKPLFEGLPLHPSQAVSPFAPPSATVASVYYGLNESKQSSIFGTSFRTSLHSPPPPPPPKTRPYGGPAQGALPRSGVPKIQESSSSSSIVGNKRMPGDTPVTQSTGALISENGTPDWNGDDDAVIFVDEEEQARLQSSRLKAGPQSQSTAPISPAQRLLMLESSLQQNKLKITSMMEELDVAALALMRAAREACISRFSASVRQTFKQESRKVGPLARTLHKAFKLCLDEHHSYMEIIREERTRARLTQRRDAATEELKRRKPKRGQDARGREAEIRAAQAEIDAQWDDEYAIVCEETSQDSPIGLIYLMREYDGVMGRLKEAYRAADAVPPSTNPADAEAELDEPVEEFVAPVSADEMAAAIETEAARVQRTRLAELRHREAQLELERLERKAREEAEMFPPVSLPGSKAPSLVPLRSATRQQQQPFSPSEPVPPPPPAPFADSLPIDSIMNPYANGSIVPMGMIQPPSIPQSFRSMGFDMSAQGMPVPNMDLLAFSKQNAQFGMNGANGSQFNMGFTSDVPVSPELQMLQLQQQMQQMQMMNQQVLSGPLPSNDVGVMPSYGALNQQMPLASERKPSLQPFMTGQMPSQQGIAASARGQGTLPPSQASTALTQGAIDPSQDPKNCTIS